MNFEKPKNENIKNPENKIKNGVNFVFKQHPELEQIGTKEQYSEYLDTIFPGSKVKDIVYHGTRVEFVGDSFHTEKIAGGRNFGIGTYFTADRYKAENYSGNEGTIISSVLNIENPFITNSRWNGSYYVGEFPQSDLKVSEFTRGNDSILNYDSLDKDSFKKFSDNIIEYTGEKDDLGLPAYQTKIYRKPEINEVVVENSDQIHILGSTRDVEEFKNFVSSK